MEVDLLLGIRRLFVHIDNALSASPKCPYGAVVVDLVAVEDRARNSRQLVMIYARRGTILCLCSARLFPGIWKGFKFAHHDLQVNPQARRYGIHASLSF